MPLSSCWVGVSVAGGACTRANKGGDACVCERVGWPPVMMAPDNLKRHKQHLGSLDPPPSSLPPLLLSTNKYLFSSPTEFPLMSA